MTSKPDSAENNRKASLFVEIGSWAVLVLVVLSRDTWPQRIFGSLFLAVVYLGIRAARKKSGGS